jgi:hypothetical protein
MFALPSLESLDLSSNSLSSVWTLPADVGDSLFNIDLSNNAISGRIPLTIGRLTNLHGLSLNNNRFVGDLPSGLFDAPLDLLNVSHNRLSGTLPLSLKLAAQTNLSYNLLRGPIPPTIEARGIATLSVAHNQLTGEIPPTLLKSDARSLDFSNNRFQGDLPAELEVSSSVRVLDLSHNLLTGQVPQGIFAGDNLLWLDLSHNRMTGQLPDASSAKALQVIRLANNRFTGRLPVGPDTTPWLAWLSVETNGFTEGLASVGQLKSLIAFNGQRNPWTDVATSRINALRKAPPPDFVVVNADVLTVSSDDALNKTRTRPEAAAYDARESPRHRDTYVDNRAPVAPDAIARPAVVRASFMQLRGQSLTIQGIVVDTAGAVIPGATVSATGPNGEFVSAVTDISGQFNLPASVPGQYNIKVELPGFNVVERSVTVGANQSSFLRLEVGVGGVPETVTVEATSNVPTKAWWNAWVSEPESEDNAPDFLIVGRAYQHVLEVGSGSVRRANGRSSPVAGRLADEIARLIRQNRSTLFLTVRLLVVGRSIRVSQQLDPIAEWREGRWQTVHRDQNTAVLAVDLRRIMRANETPRLGEGPLQNERYGAIRLNIEAIQDGCSAIAASIWDENQTVPLDQVVQIIPVGEGTKCEEYQGQTDQPTDPFGIEPYYSRAAASLHLFEFTLEGVPTSVALFASKDSGGPCSLYAWQLPGTVSGAVFQDTFRQFLNRARTGDAVGDYAPVAALVRDAIFTGTTQITGCGAKAALAELRARASKSDIDVLMRVVDKFGRNIFPPLGLISLAQDARGERSFKNRITAIEPLPRQTLGGRQCVTDWRFVLPDTLEDLDAAIQLPDALTSGRDVIRSEDDFETYLNDVVRPGPHGLVLLAHYADGYLTFESQDSVLGYQALAQAQFGDGSIALLAACSAAAISDSSLLVNALNKAGVDSLIMSPFEIHLPFGIALAKHFSTEIVKASDSGMPHTLGEVYRAALKATELELAADGPKVEGWALEFVLAGNPDAPICYKQTVE